MSDYDIKFAQVGQMKLGQFIVIEDVICKIDSMDRSKPGKHGAAKIRMTATGVFNGKKMNLLKPADTAVEVPLLGKGNAQIIADLGDKYQVMDTADYQTYEIDKADFKNLNAGDNIEYLKAGALIKIVREKSGNE
ncbi:MAG: translation initiation factor IF-5A [archaeon]|nr:translation initiation factor IF-5A [archaeon]MDD2477876.1 translation initiation factor IF-5A [Candidatus ainarchaeum sp.]MDD3084429.1 translation initiation factor IF-5A [Candidatus ainarchaeum sp.]MDD4220891.1 translation initiation factor IF-5A [Candidatus ainarchaeum sp.]MDD4662692.1 translation initiation factor IF-5A [Candidatus ainarchaeum sp.]